MATWTFADGYQTTLLSSISPAATSFTPSSTTGAPPTANPTLVPPTQFAIVLQSGGFPGSGNREVVTVTDSRSTPWTCSATAHGYSSGDIVAGVVSSAGLSGIEAQTLSCPADRLWRASNVVACPTFLPAAGASQTCVSGTAYLVGGPGCVIPAGRSAKFITFPSNVGATTPTNQWFFLATPDSGGTTCTVVATTADDTTTAWGSATAKKLSLLTGSGAYTPTVDTAVYIGIVQVATTPASIRGLGSSTTLASIAGNRLWWGTGTTGLSTPVSLGTSMTVASSAIVVAGSVSDS